MKKILPWVFFSLLLAAGAGLLAYPTVSSYINQINGSQAMQVLADTLAVTDEGELQRHRELAEGYNRALREVDGEAPGDYGQILNFGNGVMGSLEIPAISVSLPVYHGTGDEVLSRGVGHMPETAFPIGGEGNHAALVGHTGLPSARLFDDLVKLETGDTFTVSILGEQLSYCVDQILVVEPQDSQALAPAAGADYCTLVTCTPYGVNSHRLLVRGTRIFPEREAPAPTAVQVQIVDSIWWAVLASGLLLGAAVAFALLLRFRRR